MDDQPAFEVRQPDGHTHLIYADGRTEGFGEGVRVNRIPLIEKLAFKRGQDDARDSGATVISCALILGTVALIVGAAYA